MGEITITEKYALCMLKETKKFRGSELSPHLIISMIIEMILEGNLEAINYNEGKKFEFTNKYKVKLNNKQPIQEYNKKLYNYIEQMNEEEIAIATIIKSICYNISDKMLKDIVETLKEKMIKDELISIEKKKWIFGKRSVINIDNEIFSKIIEEVRTKVLESEQLADDMILLISLLKATGFLKNIFIKYDKENLKIRLKEIQDTQIYQYVKIAQDIINEMITDVY